MIKIYLSIVLNNKKIVKKKEKISQPSHKKTLENTCREP